MLLTLHHRQRHSISLLQQIQWLFSKKTYHSLKFSDVTMNSSISSSESSIKGMKAYLNKKQGAVLLVCLNLFNVQFTPETVIPGIPLPSSCGETPFSPLYLSFHCLPSVIFVSPLDCIPLNSNDYFSGFYKCFSNIVAEDEQNPGPTM